MKPQKNFFYVIFRTRHNWVLFPAEYVFLGQQKAVNASSDWPFSLTCSDLQRNHDVFLALVSANVSGLAALYRFRLAVFFSVHQVL